jgi:hypothetical protein
LKLVKQINEVIIPGLGLDLGSQRIAEITASQWLIKLGYELKEVRKGMYIDRHERPDVVEYRNEYTKKFQKTERLVLITIIIPNS